MTRATYVMRNGKLVRKDRATPLQAGSGPMVQSDYLGDQLEHHGYSDGRRTDSKSTFRRWTKEAGLVEKGNDREYRPRHIGTDTREVIRDVAYATEMVKNGYRPQIRQFEE